MQARQYVQIISILKLNLYHELGTVCLSLRALDFFAYNSKTCFRFQNSGSQETYMHFVKKRASSLHQDGKREIEKLMIIYYNV